MTEAEYIGSELQAADELRIKLEARIAELEAALRPFAEAARRSLAAHPATAESVEVWNRVTWGNFVRAAELAKD